MADVKKYRVVTKGVHEPSSGETKKRNKPVDVGTVIEIEGPVPGYLVNKVVEVGSEGDRVAVTNPAGGGTVTPVYEQSAQERQQFLGEAAKLLDDDDFTKGGDPKVDKLNDLITDDAIQKFTKDERDMLWPGIKDAVMAARNA